MKTIRTKVYLFTELSEDAKETAVNDWLQLDNGDSDAWVCIKDDAEMIGLKITRLEDHRPNEGEFLLAANEVAQNIFTQHGETCKTYKTAENFMQQWEPVFHAYMETEEGESELLETEDTFLADLLEDYRIMLKNEIEDRKSFEYVSEILEINEYYFTKDGKMFYK